MAILTLLDTNSVSAMDATFTMRDVIYIISILISGLVAWFAMQAKITKISADKKLFIEKCNTRFTAVEVAVDAATLEYKEASMNAKNGRSSIRREFKEEIEKKEQILHTRVDRLRDDNIKSYDKLENRISELAQKQDSNTMAILEAISKS